MNRLHVFSFLSSNSFLHPFLKSKFTKKIPWQKKNFIFKGRLFLSRKILFLKKVDTEKKRIGLTSPFRRPRQFLTPTVWELNLKSVRYLRNRSNIYDGQYVAVAECQKILSESDPWRYLLLRFHKNYGIFAPFRVFFDSKILWSKFNRS